MDIVFKDKYKSLGAFMWSDVPKFAVITGPNGCGKTQLLDLINQSVQRGHLRKREDRPVTRLTDEAYEKTDVLRITSEWSNLENLKNVDLQAIQMRSNQLWRLFQEYVQSPKSQSPLKQLFDRLCKDLDKPLEGISENEFLGNIDVSTPLSPDKVFNDTIAEAFLDYRLRQIELSSKGIDSSDRIAPWDMLRDIITNANLPFDFQDASETDIRAPYQFRLLHKDYGCEVQFSDLSSGEKVLLSLVFWIFHVRRSGVFPRLLLLDEPDAHLHPHRTKQFIETIRDVLVQKYSIRVIMTTHRPTTVSLAPRDSLFEMYPEDPRIRKADSKTNVIRRLTGGAVIVSEPQRIVIVEDQNDQDFFNDLCQELAEEKIPDSGDSLLNPNVPIAFLQSSRPRGNRREGESCGGRSEVEKWVPKLRDAGLTSISGLVDSDNKNDTGNGVHLLNRYCLENYLLDPIVVYAQLLSQGFRVSINGIPSVNKDRVHKIPEWTDEHLQLVANHIHKSIADHNREVEGMKQCGNRRVDFTNGRKLEYPSWLFNMSGKMLLKGYYIPLFDGKHINMKGLMETFIKLLFVPCELLDLLRKLQTGT